MKFLLSSFMILTLLNCGAPHAQQNKAQEVVNLPVEVTCRTTSDCNIDEVCSGQDLCVPAPDPAKLK